MVTSRMPPLIRAPQSAPEVLTYYLLTGDLPYQTNIAKCKSRKDLRKLYYFSVFEYRKDIPIWVDLALEKAVRPDPEQRYEDISEFIYDLNYSNPLFVQPARKSFVDRDPVLFWKMLSAILLLLLLGLLSLLHGN